MQLARRCSGRMRIRRDGEAIRRPVSLTISLYPLVRVAIDSVYVHETPSTSQLHRLVDELGAAFADVWCAIPKVVFSRTLDGVQGNARLAEASVAEEAAAALDATDKDVGIGGAGLAAAAIELGLVDELRMFRYPVVVGGGTPFLPP